MIHFNVSFSQAEIFQSYKKSLNSITAVDFYELTTRSVPGAFNFQGETTKVGFGIFVGSYKLFEMRKYSGRSVRTMKVILMLGLPKKDLKEKLVLFRVPISDFLGIDPHGEDFQNFLREVLK